MPWPLGPRGRQKFGDGLPLVESREDDLRRLLVLPGDRVDLLRRLNVDEALNDLQPVVTLEHTLPEVRGRRTIRIDRVACSTVIAEVEGQEDCVSPRESCRHTDLVRGYSEMDQTT